MTLIFSGFGAKNIHLKNPINFLFTFWQISKHTADVQNNVDSIESLAIDALHFGQYTFYVPSMVICRGQKVFCKQTAELLPVLL